MWMCELCGVGIGLAAAGLARLQEECGDNIGGKAKLSRDVGLSGETRKDGVGGVACWGPLFAQLVGSEMGLGKMNQIEAEDLSVFWQSMRHYSPETLCGCCTQKQP